VGNGFNFVFWYVGFNLALERFFEKKRVHKIENLTLNQRKEVRNMSYVKPEIVAQNAVLGSFAAGCGSNCRSGAMVPNCTDCERTN